MTAICTKINRIPKLFEEKLFKPHSKSIICTSKKSKQFLFTIFFKKNLIQNPKNSAPFYKDSTNDKNSITAHNSKNNLTAFKTNLNI